jgi:hypothetical protein
MRSQLIVEAITMGLSAFNMQVTRQILEKVPSLTLNLVRQKKVVEMTVISTETSLTMRALEELVSLTINNHD